MFENKTILVVGASGYIGANLVEKLINIKCTIIRLGRDKNKFEKIDNKKAKIVDVEFNFHMHDWDLVAKNVDIVYYLSSQTSVYIAEKDLIEDYNASVKPFVELLRYCELKHKKINIIFASSATIYGMTDKNKVDESFNDNPITVYDVHKLVIENYLKFYISKNVVKGVSLRLANVYGPGTKSSHSDRGILNLMIRKALKGEDLTVYGNGKFYRDYIYIDDVTNAFLSAFEYISKINGNHYIISSGEQNTIKDAFTLISKQVSCLLQNQIKMNYIDMPENLSLIEQRNFIGNSMKFYRETYWKSQVSLMDGIKYTIDFYKKKG